MGDNILGYAVIINEMISGGWVRVLGKEVFFYGAFWATWLGSGGDILGFDRGIADVVIRDVIIVRIMDESL